MRKLFIVPVLALVLGCGGKKTEVTETNDSTASGNAIQADTPAPSALAFNLTPGYTIKNSVALADTVNSFLLLNQSELDEKFVKGDPNSPNPDFLINYVVAVACLPALESMTIILEKVEATDAINVYFNIQRGEKQSIPSKPAQLFSIEKRTDLNTMQIFVNGKPDKSFILAGL